MTLAVAPGSTLAGFRLERVLGRGGMGLVFLAREEALGRPVALKVLAPELAADEGFRDRFLGEMRLAASLDHPHVCPVYRAGEEDGHLYLVLRYVEGEDLGERLSRTGPLEPARALALLGDLAGAVDAAHAHGLLHRDVKPENVLLDEAGNGYLADFGLARTETASGPTVAGSPAGTAAYLAPERIEGEEASSASDLYGFACLAFATFSGRPPFIREHEAALLFAHLRDAPPSLAEHRLERLDGVFARGLAKLPQERYGSCRDFVAALADALTGEAVTAVATWPETLPRPQTALVGREQELAQATNILSGGARLLTLTGPGGTGKTRLALELAARLAPGFEAGAHWLSLADLHDPGLLPTAIAKELGESESGPAEAIGERRLLLLLDNLEQLLPGAADLTADLLQACPNLIVIATSRAPLRLQVERTLPVPPLEEAEAIALFRRRAEQRGLEPADGAEPVIAEICRRLDCLPLALELAAARLRLMSPSTLLRRLDQRLPLLAGGPRDAPARQRTLSATLDWSYDLLQPEERELLAGLAVFAGGFTLDAAETVCDADLDTLQGLLDASLLRRNDTASGDPRYWMLAVVHEYAAAKLTQTPGDDVGATERLARAHATFVAQLVQTLDAERPEGWLFALDQEHPNLRVALDWAVAAGEADLALELGAAARTFWEARGHVDEGVRRLESSLALPGASAASRVGGLYAAGIMHARAFRYAEAERLDREAVAVCRGLGDERGLARVLNGFGIALCHLGRLEESEQALTESLELKRRLGDERGAAIALLSLGNTAIAAGDLGLAERHQREALVALRAAGDELGVAIALDDLAILRLLADDFVGAQILLEESLAVCRRLGALSSVASALAHLGRALTPSNRERAQTVLAEALTLFQSLVDQEGIAGALEALALWWLPLDAARAATLVGAADALRTSAGAQPDVLERRDRERLERAGTEALTGTVWDVAGARGRGVDVDTAVTMALDT